MSDDDTGGLVWSARPMVDPARVYSLSPETWCPCHQRGVAVANVHLWSLQWLLDGQEGPSQMYVSAAALQTFADVRMYPCPCCWLKQLRNQLAKVRAGAFTWHGAQYASAYDALTGLWAGALERLADVTASTSFRDLARARFTDLAHAYGSDLKGLSWHLSEPSPDVTLPDGLFYLHTGLVVDAIESAKDRCLEDLHNTPPGGVSPKGRGTLPASVGAFLRGSDSFPTVEAGRQLFGWLSGFDLRELANAVEEEVTRAVVLGCPTPKSRERPRSHIHKAWAAAKARGLSYEQIARRHTETTGEAVTRDAVAKALKRLSDVDGSDAAG